MNYDIRVELSILLVVLKIWADPKKVDLNGIEEVDADAMISTAANAGLLPLVAETLSSVDDTVRGFGKVLYVAEAARSLTRTRNNHCYQIMNLVASCLDKAGVAGVFLKGSAFLAVSGGNLAWRSMSDIDVLVSTSSLDRAISQLKAWGFSDRKNCETYNPVDHHHYLPLYAPGSDVGVELHTRLTRDAARSPLSACEIILASLSVTISDQRILVPCTDHRIIHLICHAQISDNRNFEAARLNLRDVADFGYLCRDYMPSWSLIEEKFAMTCSTVELVAFLAAAKKVLGHCSPEITVKLELGEKWADRAARSPSRPGNGLTFYIAKVGLYYAREVLRNPRKLLAFRQTVLDAKRRSAFVRMHFSKWWSTKN